MISPSQICCVIEPVDMRRGLDSLSQWIQTSLGTTPCDGTAYAFSNRSKTRLKLLIWDGTGVWCCQRRLHRGSFVWPGSDDRKRLSCTVVDFRARAGKISDDGTGASMFRVTDSSH